MKRRRLMTQVYLSFAVVVVWLFLGMSVYAGRQVRQFCLELVATDLTARAHLLEDAATEKLVQRDDAGLLALCRSLGGRTATRVTVIRPDGVVVGDSDADPARMENHAGRPEFIEALARGSGRSLRYSHTLEREMMYVAMPLYRQTKLVGALRVAVPVAGIRRTLLVLLGNLALGGLVLAGLALLLSLALARRITRPLEDMRQVAERFAQGELYARLALPEVAETRALAAALNLMAGQLDERIRTIAAQRNELEAVLGSMREGVLVVNAAERLVRINRAAATLLGIDHETARGAALQAAVRHPGLQQLVADTVQRRTPQEADLTVYHTEERSLQAHGTPLDGGVVVVLTDVTRLHRLETVRRDFVANVSHELKTPVTAVQGFTETLLDNPPAGPEEARRMLEIVARQAERLANIIEDLLTLSRLDSGDPGSDIELRTTALAPILQRAVQDVALRAQEQGVRVAMICGEVQARVNDALLEQAVANLLDNAIKYSPAGAEVTVEVDEADDGLRITVSDQGCGIPPEHLPRLFERFYRVDRARSRALGGTGLGLAIVKHIALVHGGSVAVESELGQGSRFGIHLPRAESE
ncbi:MAG: HAMP domain-containing protein [Armatimonadetes bacterium]|nr:HAMP domain-containing protein [Armatimonadota bacterium]